MQKLNQKYINSVVKKALDEDLKPGGDITTKLISFKNKRSKAKIIAKQNGVVAGLDFCKAAFKLIGKEASFKAKVKAFPREIPINPIITKEFNCIAKKIRPTANEISSNKRSRSAIMRVFRKINAA